MLTSGSSRSGTTYAIGPLASLTRYSAADGGSKTSGGNVSLSGRAGMAAPAAVEERAATRFAVEAGTAASAAPATIPDRRMLPIVLFIPSSLSPSREIGRAHV